jgi:sulfonate transport system substrate-binding protein
MTRRAFFLFACAVAVLTVPLWRLVGRPMHAIPVLHVASQKGGTRSVMLAAHALDGAPYRVEWSEFAAAAPLLEAMGAGAVDIGLAGDAPFFFAYANGAKIHAVQAGRSSSSGGAVAILVPSASPLHAVSDLRGKRIATGRGSIGHYMLLRALERAGLAPADVQITFLAPADAKAAFASGAVDAWATWGVYVPLVTQRGQGRVLADGRGLLSGYAFTAAADSVIAGKRAMLDDFLRRQARAYRWALRHQTEFATVLARETAIDPDIAATVVRTNSFVPAPIDAAMVTEEQDVLARFATAGLLGRAPKVSDALDPSFNDTVPRLSSDLAASWQDADGLP